MSDKEQFLVTVRFPSWKGEDGTQFPPFGGRYLITVPATLDESEPIIEAFKEQYTATIGGEFKGDILFIERVDYVQLHG